MPTMLILGATSDIARATALAFGMKGWDLILAGRDQAALSRYANDLATRTGRQVSVDHFDAMQPESHGAFWQQVADRVDGVFCAVGLLGNQKQAESDPDLASRILQTNFTGLVTILSLAANSFEQRGNGLIIGVSSVAGDRGRASNYFYGSAKAGLTAFMSGLRNRLHGKNVQVLTVKPGFVSTTMTESMQLPPLLTATPDQVAWDIVKAVEKRKDTLYTRWFWRWIMCLIVHLPEKISKKMKL